MFGYSVVGVKRPVYGLGGQGIGGDIFRTHPGRPCGNFMALTTHPYIAPRLKINIKYFALPVGLHGLF
jgi:hypothetical protein